MTILVYKDGKWIIDNDQPLEGVSLDNLAAILTNPKDGDVVKFDEASGMWVAGEALPSPSSADNGSELIVKNGAWTKQQKKFIVTLTPTAADYSGTMDKTVAEINAAYEAGQEIWFKVLTGATSFVEVPVSFLGKDASFDYPNFGAEIVQYTSNSMIVAVTGDTSDGTRQGYTTNIYSLTPAS